MINLLSPAENFNTKVGPLSIMSSHPFLRSSVVPAICPKCKAPALHRSHKMTSTDQFRRNFTAKRKYRCHVCDWEGWLDEARLTYPSVSLVGSVPTMNGEDVDIPSILLNEDRGRSQELPTGTARAADLTVDHDSAGPDATSAMPEHATPVDPGAAHADDIGRAPSSEERSGTLPPAELTRAQSRDDGYLIGNGATEMPATEAEPFSTTVNAGFHHQSRHKAVSCPICHGYTLFRSRSRNLSEMLRKKFTNKRPYRCHKCGWRGWVIKGL